MDKKEYTEEERWEAEKAVARMMDGGKFDAFHDEIHKRLSAMVQEDRDESAYLLVGRNAKLGQDFGGLCGKPVNIMVALDSLCDEHPEIEEILSKFLVGRKLKTLMKRMND